MDKSNFIKEYIEKYSRPEYTKQSGIDSEDVILLSSRMNIAEEIVKEHHNNKKPDALDVEIELFGKKISDKLTGNNKTRWNNTMTLLKAYLISKHVELSDYCKASISNVSFMERFGETLICLAHPLSASSAKEFQKTCGKDVYNLLMKCE